MPENPRLGQRLKAFAGRMRLELKALIFCLKSRKMPLGAKIAAGLAVGYALSPIDLIPDFIPVLGYLDDVLILPGLIYLAVRLVPRDLMGCCRQMAENDGHTAKKHWYYALPIVIFWAALLMILLWRR